MVTGFIEENEQVIVDFGTLKKEIKKIVDDLEIGVDHKLLLSSNDKWSIEEVDQGNFFIKGPDIGLSLPKNAVHFMDGYCSNYQFSKYLEQLLLTKLSAKYPSITKVKCGLDQIFSIPTLDGTNHAGIPFRYQHGLKNSTSLGCQNLVHGHASVLTLYSHTLDKEELEKILILVQNKMPKDAVFVYEQNVVAGSIVEYETGRGRFSAVYGSAYNVVVLPVETTIENLATELIEMLSFDWKELGISAIAVSEGLTKGSLVYVK